MLPLVKVQAFGGGVGADEDKVFLFAETCGDVGARLGGTALAGCGPAPDYEYQVLVTHLSQERLTARPTSRPARN